MIRFLAAIAIFVGTLTAQEQLNPPIVVQAAPQPAGPSVVAFAQNSAAMRDFDEDPAVTRTMVDALIRTVTGKSDTASAWRTLVEPGDRVGIKVTTAGGPLFATRRGVVAAVVTGLKEAGVKNIFVWDKSAAALRQCGFTPERIGCEIRAIELPKGWDRDAVLQAPVLGKVIWGDVLFAEKVRDKNADPLSSKSHLCTILSRDVTKFINIAALSDEPGCGVAGTLHSAVVGNVDNWRRFTSSLDGGASAIADLYADPLISGKCALHILDALAVVYAGGPSAQPGNSVIQAAIYAGRDPVALDAIGLRLLEKWRDDAALAPIGPKAAWLTGLGTADQKMIQLKAAK